MKKLYVTAILQKENEDYIFRVNLLKRKKIERSKY